MTSTHKNLHQLTIEEFATALRQGKLTAESFTRHMLGRIDELNPKFSAYTHVAHDDALAAARHVDEMLGAGVDLGPLMGVPIAVKEMFSIEGMPARAGTRIDVTELAQPEGPFIARLKALGCVVLGKTRATEFAMGTINLSHETPWNPVDISTKLMPGGSSSGSAVAMAAQMCLFSVGGDTGGSVRQPAAFCDVVGYKSSCSLWPLDGILPLSATLDSIGLFTQGVGDLKTIFATLTQEEVPSVDLQGVKLGLPTSHFLDDLDPEVEQAFEAAIALLRDAGAEFVDVVLPGMEDLRETFALGVPAEFIGFFGRDRFVQNEKNMDPVVWARASAALDYPAHAYISLLRRRRLLEAQAAAAMENVAAVLTPTSPAVPIPVDTVRDADSATAWNGRSLRNTQPANLLGLIGLSIPMPSDLARKPGIGLQLLCRNEQDARMIGLSRAIEAVLLRSMTQHAPLG